MFVYQRVISPISMKCFSGSSEEFDPDEGQEFLPDLGGRRAQRARISVGEMMPKWAGLMDAIDVFFFLLCTKMSQDGV